MPERNYNIGTLTNAITHDLGSPYSEKCHCDCHRLWGKDGKHIVACCDRMFEDDDS